MSEEWVVEIRAMEIIIAAFLEVIYLIYVQIGSNLFKYI